MLARLGLSVALLAAAAPTQEKERAAVKQAIERFFTAIARRDVDAAVAAWAAETRKTPDLRRSIQNGVAYVAKRPLRDIAIESFTLTSPTTAVVALSFHGKWSKADEEFDDEKFTMWTVNLVKEDGAWKWSNQNPFVVGLAQVLVEKEPADRAAYLTVALHMPSRMVRHLVLGADRAADAGEREQTKRILAAALQVAEAAKRDDLRAEVLFKRGESEFVFGNQPAAAATLARALKLKPATKALEIDIRATLAAVWVNLPEHRKNAADQARAAVALAEKLGDAGRLAIAQNVLGMVLRTVGNPADALPVLNASAATARRIGNSELLLQVLVHIATAQFELQDPGAAESSARRAVDLAEMLSEPMIGAKAHNTLGLIYMDARKFAEAEARFRICIDVWGAKATRHDELRVMALTNLGEVYRRQGKHQEAGPAFQEAIRAARTVPHPVRATTIAHNNLGMLFRRQRELEKADRHYGLSIANALKCGFCGDLIWPICNAGELMFVTKKYDTAIELFEKVTTLAEKIASPAGICAAQIGVGLCYLRRKRKGDLERAAAAFEAAVQKVEQARESMRDLMLRQGYFEERSHFYSYLTDSLLRLGRNEAAFRATERAKARSIVDVLNGGRVRVVKEMTTEEQAKEQRLMQRTAALTRQIPLTYDTNEQDDLRGALKRARMEHEEFLRDLYHRHPELSVLRGRPTSISLAQVQQRLFARNPKLCVLSFVAVGETVRLFALSPGTDRAKLSVHEIGLDEPTLTDAIDEFWRGCAVAGGEHRKSGRTLFRALLGPVQEVLAKSTHVAVVPDGPLHRLPFHALPDGDGERYLVERLRVSYAPSVTALVEMNRLAENRRRRTNEKLAPIAAFGAPKMPEGYGDLPAAEDEVIAIAKLLGSAAVTGAGATETRAKNEVVRARFVHFATHGKAEEDRPMYSHIVLTADEHNDGLLHAREIAELPLRADLVVLSACETGRGKKIDGEGLVGLAWSLFVAGAPTQVVTQWQVSDIGTKTLMTDFYGSLVDSKTPSAAESMRAAQMRALRREGHRHPYYWAPFFVMGAW